MARTPARNNSPQPIRNSTHGTDEARYVQAFSKQTQPGCAIFFSSLITALDSTGHMVYIYGTIFMKGADIPMMMILISVVSAVPFGTDERGVSASVL